MSSDTLRRRAYYVAAMALHAGEDKMFRGANVAGFATPWGDFTNGDNLNDGYHRVWGRDLYQQATGLIAAGDPAQALRMAQFMWNHQFISTDGTPGDNTTYQAGSFPRYSPVGGISGATPQQLGCCEQLDQDAFAILLAWMTGLTDNATYQKIKVTANHIQAAGPDTTERWEEQGGKSPSSIAAEIAGLVAAADIARQNGDTDTSATRLGVDGRLVAVEPRRLDVYDQWLLGRPPRSGSTTSASTRRRTRTTRAINSASRRAASRSRCRDFGFLDLVRLGERLPNDSNVSTSLSPTASASDNNSTVEVTMPNGDIYFHRYNHDDYGESNERLQRLSANIDATELAS